MFEQIILGAIQGITEWIPVSSKGCVIAAKVHLFHSQGSLNELINYALLLHLGTFFAALIYFWDDIKAICASAFNTKDSEGRKVLIFLATTTILTALGQVLINKVDALAHSAPQAKAFITLLIASLLIVAGFLQLKAKPDGKRTPRDLTPADGIILGLTQAIATLPGLSRAGTTMAILSLRNFDKENMLKLSFLMSMPVIFIGNILKNYKAFLSFGPEWIGVLTAFVVGIISIGALMQFARRVNFGLFLIFIGSILATALLCGFID
jgi:undecaprenyl-diphosphatase